MKKRVRKALSQAGLPVAALALDYLFRWVYRSARVTEWGREAVNEIRARGTPVLFAYWHRWAIHHLYRFSGGGHITMSSRKDAGELGYRVLSRHGYITARGASSVQSSRGRKDRGGREALAEMARILRETGYDAGLTVDGPHGPPLQVKPGIVFLARETRAPIVPMAVASRPRLVLPTWDSMHVFLPFSQIVYLFGEPIFIPGDEAEDRLDTHRQELQDRMMELTRQAEDWFRRGNHQRTNPRRLRRA